MTTVISEVYETFRAAGVDDATARKATEALSAESLATKADIAEIKAELKVNKWILALVIAATSIPMLKTLFA
jgi:hypothetical protein